MRRQQKADGPQDDGADGHGQHRLRGNVIHQILAAGTHVLGTEGSAGHGETRAERNDEERDREADRHRRNGGGAEPAHPEGVGELVARLQRVAQNDGNRETNQRRRDRPFQQSLSTVGHARSRSSAPVIR
jgi:hypothetical protein